MAIPIKAWLSCSGYFTSVCKTVIEPCRHNVSKTVSSRSSFWPWQPGMPYWRQRVRITMGRLVVLLAYLAATQAYSKTYRVDVLEQRVRLLEARLRDCENRHGANSVSGSTFRKKSVAVFSLARSMTRKLSSLNQQSRRLAATSTSDTAGMYCTDLPFPRGHAHVHLNQNASKIHKGRGLAYTLARTQHRQRLCSHGLPYTRTPARMSLDLPVYCICPYMCLRTAGRRICIYISYGYIS